jgi:hypothetical protein
LQERFRSFSNPKFAAKVIAISISHQHQPSASAISISHQHQPSQQATKHNEKHFSSPCLQSKQTPTSLNSSSRSTI